MKETGSIILRNAIKTPDGTELVSRHRHDYVTHMDANGERYMVDGGNAYLRRTDNQETARDFSECFFSHNSFDQVREHLEWGSCGKEGNEPLHYIKLGDMDTEHIEAILRTHELDNFRRGAFLIELALRESA